MLAPRRLPPPYRKWNQHWGAPFGFARAGRAHGTPPERLRAAGPFAFQPNNSTRTFEYPWAYQQIPRPPGLSIVDLGAGLSGLQFVLAMEGYRVSCVDPGLAPGAGEPWGYGRITHEELNAAFGCAVKVVPARLEDAGFALDSVDCIACISTLEHLAPEAAASVMRQASGILRPGGRLIATVDLFLNLVPFTSRRDNEWGTNIDVRALIDAAPGLRLVAGRREELYGFPEFDAGRIQAQLERYCIGDYPCLAQCFVLEKPVA